MFSTKNLSIDFIQKQLKTNLNGNKIEINFPVDILVGKPRLASVLIPLLLKENEWHVLFIRRTSIPEDFHSGQVAFPGGSQDASDKNPEDAALRETFEEIGVSKEAIQVLGQLNRFLTISNFMVTPIVGVIPWPFEFVPSENEVSRIFTIPLAWLADESNREKRDRILDNNVSLSVTYFKHFDSEILWGASAKIIESLLKTLGI